MHDAYEPVDYVVIGHITQDLTPEGPRIGGTATFAARTAIAFGLRVGVVTAWAEESGAELLDGVAVANHRCSRSTTFENVYTPQGRIQTVHHVAPALDITHVPARWRTAPIVHLGPIANEVALDLVSQFSGSLMCVTHQGWLRQWDERGRVSMRSRPELTQVLADVSVAVISTEDVQHDPASIEAMIQAAPMLAVTEQASGATIHTGGEAHRLPAPQVVEVEPTGAGDIFAATLFVQLHLHGDPVRALRAANAVAADSVARPGLSGAPTAETLRRLVW